MILRRFAPLRGERIAAVSPAMARDVEGIWNRRLRLFGGRSLTAGAFTLEQEGRAGLAATANQLLSWGVVAGLEASVTREENTWLLELAAGFGIAPGGEDIVIPTQTRVELRRIPGLEAGQAFGILVLRPARARLLGEVRLGDQCEYDETTDAFTDWQWIDGCSLAFVPWPVSELGAIPVGTNARSRAAAAIFAREISLAPQETCSWQEAGVPVAVISLDDAGAPVFLDCAAVVREGGRPRRRTDLIAGSGHAVLWQARLLQFSEQVAQTDFDSVAGGGSRFFAVLPPAGLLPAEWFDLGFDLSTGLRVTQRFFPLQFDFVAAPIPLEQLDAAIEASASFAPIDMARRERLELLVPVPQVFFEPGLLQAEQVDHRFFEAVNQAIERRAEWLGRRVKVRTAVTQVTSGLTGKNPQYPAKDPNQIDATESVNLDPPPDPADTPVDVHKLAEDYLKGLIDFAKRIFGDSAMSTQVQQLITLGTMRAAEQVDLLADSADDLINVGFVRVQTDMYRLRQIMLSGSSASRLATSPALAGIAEARTAVAREEAINSALKSMKKNTAPGVVQRPAHRVRIPTAADFDYSLERMSGVAGPEVEHAAAPPPAYTASEVKKRASVRYTQPSGSLRRGIAAEGTLVEGGIDILLAQSPGKVYKEMVIPTDPVETITQPVVGREEIRTTTTEQRIQPPKGPEARDFALSTKYAIVSSLKNSPVEIKSESGGPGLRLSEFLGSVLVPALGVWDAAAKEWTFEADDKGEKLNLKRENKLLSALDQSALNRILEEPDDNRITDEAHYFYAAVDIIQSAIGSLRSAEYFVEVLRELATFFRTTSQILVDALAKLKERLAAIEDELAEARQDVAVGKALLAEEEQRVALINRRRARIIKEHVPFLCFRRPPTATCIRSVPTRVIDPEVLTPAVPVCLARNLEPPVELQKLIDLIREAPVSWFPRIEALLERLNRREDLRDALRHARARLGGKVSAVLDNPDFLQISSGRFTSALTGVLTAQRELTIQYRNLLPQVDPEVALQLTWREGYQQCRRVLSIGDLVDGVGGRSDLSRLAGLELDQIGRVAACLDEKFAGVLPAIRLDWALRFSQYDLAVDFRNLRLMPRWSEIDYLDRHDLQSYVDWLFNQVDDSETKAVESINNLVRVAILLASHAPVNRLIQGAVDEPADVEEGGSAKVSFEASVLAHVRRGLEVHFVKEDRVIASGIIDDLLDRRAQITITRNLTQQTVLKLDTSIRVQTVANADQTAIVRTLLEGTASRTEAFLAG